MKGNPDSPHWWLRPMTQESLKDLLESVERAHTRGLGFASVTMNQLEIALTELQERMEQEKGAGT